MNKSSRPIHIPIKTISEISSFRTMMKGFSEQNNIKYRVRERKNRSGRYLSVTLNRER